MLLTTHMARPAAGLSPLYLPSGGQGDPTPHDPSLLFQKIRQGALWGFTATKERKAKAEQTKRDAPMCADATGRHLLVQRRPCELELVLVLRSWANDDSSESDGAASRNPRHDRGGSATAPSSGVSGGTLRFFLEFPGCRDSGLAETPPLLVLR